MGHAVDGARAPPRNRSGKSLALTGFAFGKYISEDLCGYASIENLQPSYLWKTPEAQELLEKGWLDTDFNACMHGAAYRKMIRVRSAPGWKPPLEARCCWDAAPS